MEAAWIGFLGVAIGSVVTLIGSTVIPWIRDTQDRDRIATQQEHTERRLALLEAEAALLHYRQAMAGTQYPAQELARVGVAINELAVRLTPAEQPVLDVLYAVLAMIQESRPGVGDRIGEAMMALNLWVRGDFPASRVIEEVETRAKLKFSEDRKTVGFAN